MNAYEMSDQLSNLQEMLNHKIKQTREAMHKVEDITKRDNLWIKAETTSVILPSLFPIFVVIVNTLRQPKRGRLLRPGFS
jgi:hypothetical protein